MSVDDVEEQELREAIALVCARAEFCYDYVIMTDDEEAFVPIDVWDEMVEAIQNMRSIQAKLFEAYVKP